MPVPYLTDEEIYALITPADARRALENVLLDGFHPAEDPARISVPVGTGELLLMPSSTATYTGVKVLTVAPDNQHKGLPRIQALYHLCDTQTLSPRLILEGESVTNLRTPAVSALAADRLASPEASRLLIIGSGPQALGHAHALAAIRPLTEVLIFSPTPGKAESVVERLSSESYTSRTISQAELKEATEAADIICCCTSAAEPVIDDVVRDGVCVIAMGSHSPERRELPGSLVRRALLVVENEETAWREAGDVVMAHEEQAFPENHIHSLEDLVRGEVCRAEDRPNVIKTTGMSWEDLAVAIAIAEASHHGIDDAEGAEPSED